MTTPLVFVLLLFGCYLFGGMHRAVRADYSLRGRLGLSAVFCFAGIGHFVQAGPMAMMLPEWLPTRVPIVYLSGVLEILLSVALLFPGMKRKVGILIIVMLILFLPVNIYAAVHRIPIGGHAWGPAYLAIRVPLQLLLIGWTYSFTLRHRNPRRPSGHFLQ